MNRPHQCEVCGQLYTTTMQSLECESCHDRASGRHLDPDNSDAFFRQTTCDRCGADFNSGRIMSWFTGETICMSCSKVEKGIRKTLPDGGSAFEGCGYVPGYGDGRVIRPGLDRALPTAEDRTDAAPTAVEPAVQVQGIRRVLLTKGDFNE